MKPTSSTTTAAPQPPSPEAAALGPEVRIGLALSGGGSRAIAFHLGCLRALHDLGILSRVTLLSTVSGGSVIGGLYGAFDEPFDEFEKRVRTMLKRGLVGAILNAALTTPEGIKALGCLLLTGALDLLNLAVRLIAWLPMRLLPADTRRRWSAFLPRFTLRRAANLTTVFRRALDRSQFAGRTLKVLGEDKPNLIINAAELRTGSAFYFSPAESGSWRLGKLAKPDLRYADAVAASAAYPLFLPALDLAWPFNKRDGSRRVERVLLSDGGIYDNLGLAPMWPRRDPAISLNVQPIDFIICCRAGYGLRHDPPTHFLTGRLTSAFSCLLDRTQNLATNRLFELRDSGQLKGFILPYLGQDDSRLACPPPGLVSREEAFGYPTDFSAMSEEWIERLSKRGEQLTHALWAEHAANSSRPAS